jgi:hypothetical protein
VIGQMASFTLYRDRPIAQLEGDEKRLKMLGRRRPIKCIFFWSNGVGKGYADRLVAQSGKNAFQNWKWLPPPRGLGPKNWNS